MLEVLLRAFSFAAPFLAKFEMTIYWSFSTKIITSFFRGKNFSAMPLAHLVSCTKNKSDHNFSRKSASYFCWTKNTSFFYDDFLKLSENRKRNSCVLFDDVAFWLSSTHVQNYHFFKQFCRFAWFLSAASFRKTYLEFSRWWFRRFLTAQTTINDECW